MGRVSGQKISGQQDRTGQDRTEQRKIEDYSSSPGHARKEEKGVDWRGRGRG
jgi:hypothetical protein